MHEDFLLKKLDERVRENSLRALYIPAAGMIDFCSNDYLGIVKHGLINQKRDKASAALSGATGSRLLSGNYKLIQDVEEQIANFHQAKAGLIFNSGYAANTGFIQYQVCTIFFT